MSCPLDRDGAVYIAISIF